MKLEQKIRKPVAMPSAAEEKTCLLALKEWLKKQPHLPVDISENDLLLFLHCCHYSVEQAKKVADSYYTIRSNTELFTNRYLTSSRCKEILHTMHFFQFADTTARGDKILFFRLSTPDVNVFDYIEVTKYAFAILDVYVEENARQPGYQIVYDMANVSLGHVLKISAHMALMRKELLYVQEALPFNLTAIHMLNAMPVVEHMMNLVKPWTNSELLEMISFYKPDETHKIYNIIPKDLLPQDFGGSAPSCEKQSEKARALLLNSATLIKFKESQIVDEKKRLNTSFKNDSLGLQGCFKKLDLD